MAEDQPAPARDQLDDLLDMADACRRETRRCLPIGSALRQEHAAAAQTARESTKRLRRPTREELRDAGR